MIATLMTIPWFEFPTLHLGPIPIQPFGILVALGILVGARVAAAQARRRGLDARPLADFLVWAIAGGVVGGHLFHLFAYHPEELAEGGVLQILRVWDGLSSFGGVIGGVLAGLLFFRRRGIPLGPYLDPLALAIAPGWAIARLGCFAVHDHPGRLSSFFLAVEFPGGARHDLGFYDALLLGAITVVLTLAARRPAFAGRLLPLLALLYGAGRFALDFLRATDLAYVDARYLGLTPGQYVAIALVAWGATTLLLRRPATARDTAPSSAAQRPPRRVYP